MTARIPAGIAGVGSALPERVMTNEDFARVIDTSDEWIVQRTGIRERRFASEGEATSDFCVGAAKKALERAGVSVDEVDLIIVGTVSPDHMLPSCACLVQDKLGAKNAGAFDVNAACTGFLTALHTAEAFVAAGRAKRVLAIGAETLSRFLNMKDRASCILFGDGAGAAVVMPHEECGQGEILRSTLGADGSGFEFIHMPGGGSKIPASEESLARGDHYIGLKGRDVYRFAVNRMSDLIKEMSEGYSEEQIGLVVPHQVNARIIQAAMGRVGWPESKCIINIDRYGNTSAATVPIALDEAIETGRVEKDKYVVFCAFGAGLTWGGTLVRW